jgi:hypothetical protein
VSIVTQTLTTLADMENVRSDWRALWQRAAAATMFQSPDWLIPWWRHFAPGHLTCIALWRGEELVGIAPLYREECSRRLLPLGISLSDYLDVLLAEELSDNARHAMQAEIARAADANEICFPDVAPNASVLGLALNGCFARRRPSQPSPELALGPADNPLKNVPPMSARTYARRKIVRAGAVALLTMTLPPLCPR